MATPRAKEDSNADLSVLKGKVTRLLRAQVISKVLRLNDKEMVLEFEDKTRLIVSSRGRLVSVAPLHRTKGRSGVD